MKQTKNTEHEGLLITLFGNSADVENSMGKVIRCHLRKNAEPVITGDQVVFQLENENSGIILGPKPRKSLLFRPGKHDKNKLMAANIDVIVIVTAPPPLLSEYLIDRYLIAAENLSIKPVILFNKTDLLTDENREEIISRLSIYQKIGYKVLFSSIFTQGGLDDAENFLHSHQCVLVGTSGVGKSSIIAKCVSEQAIMIGETSAAGLGKHTTTATKLYHLPQGGSVIDSPGIREFDLWDMDKKKIQNGFPEFVPFLKQCKFRDCQHIKETGCAVEQAVLDQKIPATRFASYKEMIKGKHHD